MLKPLMVMILWLCAFAPAAALAADQEARIGQGDHMLYGSLVRPDAQRTAAAVLIVPGSGPDDRNGDEVKLGITPHSLRLIAEGLAASGIISLRIDKRGVAASMLAAPPEADLRLQTYVDDAVNWVRFLRAQPGVGCVVILGHSEGALIAALAAQQIDVCGVVSLSGAGRGLGDVVEGQARDAGVAAPVAARIHAIILSLRAGKPVDDVPAALAALFRPSVQPYLISEINLDPGAELAKVRAPVLIVQGDNDLQVKVEDAQRLAAAQPHARLLIIKGMNHMLKLAPTDRAGNVATYSDPDLPLAPGLVPAIVAFVKAASSPR